MNIETNITIELWKSRFNMSEWTVEPVPILPEQVTYDHDVPDRDRYFIGVLPSHSSREAKIFHDRPLLEEDIVHELIHVKHPSWSEDKVNSYQNFIIRYYEERNCTRMEE